MIWNVPLLLISALSLPLIVILHLLVQRRRKFVVPSLVLWDRLLMNMNRAMTLRRLTANLLMLLQLIVAVLIVIALADPRIRGRSAKITGPVTLVVDVSAGMSAREPGGTSRFDEAVEKAKDVIRSKAPGVEIMLIAGGARAVPLTPFTSSRRELMHALGELRPTDVPGRPRDVLRAAEALAAAKSGGGTHFITDTAFDRGPIPGQNTRITQVGRPLENAGITVFAVRGLVDGARELLVTAENFGKLHRKAELRVLAGSRILLQEILEIPPGERETRTVWWRDALSGRVSAALESAEYDALDADNGAYAVLTPDGRVRTALITPGNWFLETALSVHPSLNLEVFYGVESWSSASGPWDLVIADRLFPPEDPGGHLLAIYPFSEPGAPPLPLTALEKHNDANPLSWNSDHPALHHVDFNSISILSAVDLEADFGVDVLAAGAAGPLILAGQEENRRWLAFSFDILESSLPLRPAFPIVLYNALSWLVSADFNVATALRTGEQWTLPPEFAGSAWKLTAPETLEEWTSAGGLETEKSLDWAGFWSGRSEGKQAVEIGVSLLSEGESNLNPRWRWTDTPDPAAEVGTQSPASSSQQPFQTLVAVLLAVALLFMALEWGLLSHYWRSR